jgi:hypothetical protein
MSKQSKAKRRAMAAHQNEQRKRKGANPQAKPKSETPSPVTRAEPKEEPKPPEIKETPDQKPSTEINKRQPSTRAECAIAWFTAILTIFAIVQGVAMIAQNNIMRDQMGQTAETLEIMRVDQRPWVVSRQPALSKPIAVNEMLDFIMPLANSGKSPAIVKHMAVGIWDKKSIADLDDDFHRLWRKAKSAPRETVIGPESNFDGLIGRETNYIVDDEKMNLINSDAIVLVAAVVCEYTGVDGGSYATEGCYFYDWVRGQFISHEKHNRIDVPQKERGE